jgi:hypothetical protein
VSDDKPASGFVPLKSVATRRGTASSGSGRPGGTASSGSPAAPDPAAALAEIRQIYFKTSRRTIEHDFAHAIELLKALPDEETRQKAHVYMEGLAEMRKEWEGKGQRGKVKGQRSDR